MPRHRNLAMLGSPRLRTSIVTQAQVTVADISKQSRKCDALWLGFQASYW